MDGRLVIAIVGVLALLVVAVIFAYRKRGEAEFSIRDWVKFRFRGSNEEGASPPEADIQVTDGDFVRRDKITYNIHSQQLAESVQTVPLPELTLKLFRPGPPRVYTENLLLEKLSSSPPRHWLFGLVLENTVPETAAKGIYITLRLYWGGGNSLRKAPRLEACPNATGWETKAHELRDGNNPAVLVFRNPNMVCLHKHPEEWASFKLTLGDEWSGQLDLHYVVSATEPLIEKSGKLTITVDGGG